MLWARLHLVGIPGVRCLLHCPIDRPTGQGWWHWVGFFCTNTNSTVWNRKGNALSNGIIKCRLFSPLCLSFSIQMLVSLGIQQRLLRFLERSRMSGAYSQQSSVSSVPSTARTNDSVVSEHCVRILNKLKTRGNETWRSLQRRRRRAITQMED